MNQTRRDNKNRILRTGESQRKDGRYVFKYVDVSGQVRFAYSWRLVATDRVPKGKRPCVPLREQESEIRRNIEDGIDCRGRSMTVCQLYERYVRCNGNVRPNTELGRAQLARMLREDEIGSRAIGSVRPSDARAWAQRMSARGYSYGTISNHKRSMKAAFHLAVQDDLVRRNPFDFKVAEVIGNDAAPKVPLSAKQERALLEFLRCDRVYGRYYDEVVILLGTGLRISELCGLTENDVDVGRGEIRVTHQLLAREGGGMYVAPPKTANGERSIHMSQQVREAFARVMARPRKGIDVEVDGVKGFLFLNKRGIPQTNRGYGRIFRGMVARYAQRGLSPELPSTVTAHTFRHTFCTNMAMAGMNPKALQYVMGHADVQMTLGYYAHATADSALEEMRRVVG